MVKIGISAKVLKGFIDDAIQKNPDILVVISVDKLGDIYELLPSGAKSIWFSINAELSESNDIELTTDEILKVFI